MIPHHQPALHIAALADDPAALASLQERLGDLGMAVVATASVRSAPVFERTQVDLRVIVMPQSPLHPAAFSTFRRADQPPVFALHHSAAMRQLLLMAELGVNGHALTSVAELDLELGLRVVARGGLFLCPAMREALRRSFHEQVAQLSEEEAQLIALVSSGHANAVIARTFGLTEKMVEYRLRQLCERLGLANKIELAAWWGRRLLSLHHQQGPPPCTFEVAEHPTAQFDAPLET